MSTSSTAVSSTASPSTVLSSSGVRTAYVLQVGRIESPLRPPKLPWEVGLVAFEIARRHRFATTMAHLPDRHRRPRPAHRKRADALLRPPTVSLPRFRVHPAADRRRIRCRDGVPRVAGGRRVRVPPVWVRRVVGPVLLFAIWLALVTTLADRVPGRFDRLALARRQMAWLASSRLRSGRAHGRMRPAGRGVRLMGDERLRLENPHRGIPACPLRGAPDRSSGAGRFGTRGCFGSNSKPTAFHGRLSTTGFPDRRTRWWCSADMPVPATACS